jgi:1,4-dihydroxy-2-naphthoate octaprenyltransferase
VFRKAVDFFVYTSLYVAVCAVLMIWQTSHLLLGIAPSGRLLGFVFFSTICSYNFHWYLTPRSASPSRRVQWTHHHKALHFILYLTGAVGAAVYFFYLTPFIPALCLGALLTFLYSAPKLPQRAFHQLRRIAIGKTFFLAAVWVYVTTLLPVIVAEAPWNGSFLLFTAGRFFLTYAVCLLFDYRDRQDDKAQGILSLITLLNEKGIDLLFAGSLIGFFVSNTALSFYHYAAFYILLLLVPGAVLAALYREAKRNFSDDLYYIVLDGLMMFSSLLMLVFRI